MRARIVLVLAALLASGCSTTKKLYDGPERDPAELAVIGASKSYVFSINNRRTDHAREPNARLQVLPGTQQLIVHLDDRMADSYGHVGVRTVFCALRGHTYTVYPVPDMIARLWEPAVRDDVTGQDVSPRPCAGAPPAPVAPAPGAPVPSPARPEPRPAPPPAATVPATPPAASPPATTTAPVAPPPAKPAEPTSPAGPPAPATTAPPAPAATPVPPPPPGVLAPGAQAKLRAPARTRSLPDAPAVKGLEAGVTVTLKVMLKKDNGAWWYVTAPAGSGWIRDAELETPAP